MSVGSLYRAELVNCAFVLRAHEAKTFLHKLNVPLRSVALIAPVHDDRRKSVLSNLQIARHKARTRYEFGVKTSIATTSERCKGGQFVLGAMALPGNPYDGHTLEDQIDQVTKLTGAAVKRAYVDRGYRGHKVERDGLDITLSQTRRIKSPTIRREMRRRSGIEPVIGHLKDDGHLERNHLAGHDGDAINAILSAAGHNLRLLARWVRELLLKILVWTLCARRKTALSI